MAEVRTVSSLFDNLAQVLHRRMPRAGRALLGARWAFGSARPARDGGLCEYSMPAGYVEALAHRTGLRIREHPAGDSLDAHIAFGEAAIALVDSFYLEYRPAFGRVHSGRTVQVRAGDRPGEVWLSDRWLPAYEGPFDRDALERARYSAVPLDPVREPIFAGRTITGEWYSVDVGPTPVTDVREWSAAVLGELVAEGLQGLAALERLRGELRPRDLPERDTARELSLLFRSELSTRVFLCDFLIAAAGWREEPSLREAAREYFRALGSMQILRDLLAKSLTHPRLSYAAIMHEQLALAIAAEVRLADVLTRTQGRSTPCSAITI